MKEYNIVENLPDFLKSIKEFCIIADMINSELELFRRRLQNSMINKCISDMDEYGISRLEKSLKITPLKADTLEERRFRLKLYSNGDRPYTFDIIDERLKKLCGADKIFTSVDEEHYQYNLNIDKDVTQSQLTEIIKMINKVLPCNMLSNAEISNDISSKIYCGAFVCDTEYGRHYTQKYNTFEDIKGMTYEDLKNQTYEDLLQKED